VFVKVLLWSSGGCQGVLWSFKGDVGGCQCVAKQLLSYSGHL